MDLREFLLRKTNVGDIVVIQDAGCKLDSR